MEVEIIGGLELIWLMISITLNVAFLDSHRYFQSEAGCHSPQILTGTLYVMSRVFTRHLAAEVWGSETCWLPIGRLWVTSASWSKCEAPSCSYSSASTVDPELLKPPHHFTPQFISIPQNAFMTIFAAFWDVWLSLVPNSENFCPLIASKYHFGVWRCANTQPKLL